MTVTFGYRLFADSNRESYLQQRASGRMVLGGNFTSMLLHDAVTDTQSQPGPFAHTFGSVKRIENVFRIVNTWPRIVERRNHVSVLRRDADTQPAAAASFHHGIRRVVDDIQIDLFQLVR